MRDLGPLRELPTVLLIDDDLVSREVTATLLTMGGFTVHTAEDGAAARDLLHRQECRPGIIMMDAQMPGLSGLSLIVQLRAACNSARIIVVSGSTPPADVTAAADGLLLKPFGAEELYKLLAEKTSLAPASRLAPDESIVKAETLAQLRRMMPEPAVRQIFAAVVADLDRRIEALGTAIAKHDAVEVRRIGHAIKGGCGMAGAMQAARLGALLEDTPADDNQLDNCKALIGDLRAAALALQRMLDAGLRA
jgi:CheY-like chemotaxis protein